MRPFVRAGPPRRTAQAAGRGPRRRFPEARPEIARVEVARVEVADWFGRAAREAAIYNLDRRPVVLSLFGDLAEVGVGGAG